MLGDLGDGMGDEVAAWGNGRGERRERRGEGELN